MFEFVNKIFKKNISLEKSGVYQLPNSALPYFDMIHRLNTEEYLSDSDAIEFYNNVSCVGDAINKAVTNIADIDLVLCDNRNKQYLDYYCKDLVNTKDRAKIQDFFKLIKKPMFGNSFVFFMRRLATYFLVTGTAYIIAYGYKDSNPSHLEVIDNRFVSPDGYSDDGMYPNYYTITRDSSTFTFNKVFDKKTRSIRYLTNDKLKELFIIKNVSTRDCNVKGVSIFNFLKSSIRQFFAGDNHNYSMLRNGARLSAIFVAPKGITKDQRASIEQQIRAKTGTNNAGGIMMLEGDNFQFTSLANKYQDMDFKDLKAMLSNAIYNGLNIPLALVVVGGNMGINGYQAAKYAFFSDNVILNLNYILKELSFQLLPRFGLDYINYDISFIIANIRAIRDIEYENLKKLERSYFLTTNERRNLINYSNIEDGDNIMVPANEMSLENNNEYFKTRSKNVGETSAINNINGL